MAKRQLKMHPALLLSVIKDQAGTLWKATLEGIMNSIDAKASEIRLDLTNQMLTITDNGKGFSGRQEIEDFFETFGQPHDESEHKTYGRFRMGRGQLMAYGRNTWETGNFRMTVDVGKNGLDYDLEEKERALYDGCKITIQLYAPLTNVEHAEMLDQIKMAAKYVNVDTYLNGEKFNTPPASQTWDHETEIADIRFSGRRGLHIYNQGILVCTKPAHELGLNGEVVSRGAMKVNFARNDLMSDCPVWRQVKRLINKIATERNVNRAQELAESSARRGSLSHGEKQRLAQQIKTGEVALSDAQSATLFYRAKGGSRAVATFKQIRNAAFKNRVTMPTTTDSRAYADRIHEHRMSYVLDPESLNIWDLESPEALIELLNEKRPESSKPLQFTPFAELVKSFHGVAKVLPNDQLTPNERIVQQVLQQVVTGYWFNHGLSNVLGERKTSDIHIGTAPTGMGHWTDAQGNICLSRETVAKCKLRADAWETYILAMLHERCHTGATDVMDHKHSNEFYRRFHSALMQFPRALGQMVDWSVRLLPYFAKRERKRLNKQVLQDTDYREQADATDLDTASA